MSNSRKGNPEYGHLLRRAAKIYQASLPRFPIQARYHARWINTSNDTFREAYTLVGQIEERKYRQGSKRNIGDVSTRKKERPKSWPYSWQAPNIYRPSWPMFPNQDPRGFAASKGLTGSSGMASQGPARGKTGDKEKRSPPDGDKPAAPLRKVTLAAGKEPTFYIGGGNGVALVEGPLVDLGWKRITDKNNENFKIKWVECKNTINYGAFKEGDQLVNHIPNCNLLTNKMGLLNSLQAFDKLNTAVKRRDTRLRLSDFIPETYRLDDAKERDQFLEAFKAKDIWICKPTGMNQGKGIYLVRDLDEFKVTLQERDEKMQQSRRPPRANMGRIIQRYLTHPLLLEGRKFDIRAYMLVANTVPYLVLYHKGYVRLSLQDYDLHNTDLTAHLTNQYIQKRDPNYKEEKESTAWSMDKFNDYINQQVAEEKGVEEDWVYNTLTTKMKQIMQYCFHAVKNRLQCKVGYFDLYGLDFMVDAEMKVWLIEVNVNPSLATNCEALREVIPGVVKETIHVTLECYEKARRGQPIMPLHSLQKFEVLYNGCTRSKDRSTPGASRSIDMAAGGRGVNQSPVRRQRSRSPTKDHSRTPTKTQGASDSKSVSGMTPKATRIIPTAPPALRGAVPPSGSSSKKALVANSISHGEHIKLRMTHNDGTDSPSSAKSIRSAPESKVSTPINTTNVTTENTANISQQTDESESKTESSEKTQSQDNTSSESSESLVVKQEQKNTKVSELKTKREKTSRTKLQPVPRTRTVLRSSKRRTKTPDRGN